MAGLANIANTHGRGSRAGQQQSEPKTDRCNDGTSSKPDHANNQILFKINAN